MHEQETVTLGEVSETERAKRVEAAIHAKLEAIAASHENRILEGVADMITRFDQPDRSKMPELLNRSGEVVHHVYSPPYYQRLPKEVQAIRNPESDHWMIQWIRGQADNDIAARIQAEAKLQGMFPDLYRADTLEGAASGVGGFAAGTGGVLLPRPLEDLVAIALAKIAKMARWASTYIMTAQEHNIPTAGACTAYMQGEATSPLTGGEPALAQVPLRAYNMIGTMILGRDLIDDAAANVVPIFVQLMGDAMAALEDAEFLRLGTGTAPHPTKLAGTLYAEVSSAELKYTDVVTMYMNVGQRYRESARWLIDPNTLLLMAKVKDGMGRPFYQSLLDPPMAITDTTGAVGTLLGKPVHEVDLTAGDVYFGDVSRNYAIGRRRGITVESSRDFLFSTRRVIFMVSQRLAGNNIDTSAGQLCQGITSATSL